jgi:RND family efflux transporter MFP subunit
MPTMDVKASSDLEKAVPAAHKTTGRRTSSVIAGIVCLLLASIAWMLLREPAPTGSTPATTSSSSAPAPATAGALSVQVMKPQRKDIAQTLTLPANISPWYQATLYGKVSGYVKWIGFDKGDFVKKGQLLAVIDAPEIEDQYQQAESDYQIKKLTYERYHNVWKDNPDVIAKQDVDVAKAAAESAKHLRDNRKTMLNYTKVSAPFEGIITARFADPGALIQAATGSATQAAPIFTIMNMETVRIYMNVPQELAFLAKPDIPATLTVHELPGMVIKAAITRTTEVLDPATRTLLVEIDVPNRDHKLQPGTFINATLSLREHSNALVIPPAALVSSDNGKEKAVFIVEQNRARLVPIKTGIDNGVWIEVIEGLTGDEDVVVVGKSSLLDGQAVAASQYNLPAGLPARQKF